MLSPEGAGCSVRKTLLALGWVINLMSGVANVFTVILLVFALSVVYRLAKVGGAFGRTDSPSPF